jgi:hypothetical protein
MGVSVMWIFLNDAFISVVAHKDQPHALLVRARAAADIRRLFPAARVVCTPAADYRYRAIIPRAAVAAVIADKIAGITYTNFKDSVSDAQRHNAYLRVWAIMSRWQEALAAKYRRTPERAPVPDAKAKPVKRQNHGLRFWRWGSQ